MEQQLDLYGGTEQTRTWVPRPENRCRYAQALAVLEAEPDLWPAPFTRCMVDNRRIWEAFVQNTLNVVRKGFKHYSARTIIHFMRHHSAMTEAEGEWKINNNHSPYFARLFDRVYPEHVGLWEMRETAQERAGEG